MDIIPFVLDATFLHEHYRVRLEASGIKVSVYQWNAALFLTILTTFIIARYALSAWRFAYADLAHHAEPSDITRAFPSLDGRG